jgi:hypothetical protein
MGNENELLWENFKDNTETDLNIMVMTGMLRPQEICQGRPLVNTVMKVSFRFAISCDY